MLIRDFLKAGDYIEPLPNGIPVTLQYGSDQTLEKVYIGYSVVEGEDSKELFSYIMKANSVPMHIGTNKGTAFIRGVVYTGVKHYDTLGELPICQIEDILQDLKSKSAFNVFVGNVYATSINLVGATQIRTWLQSQGFKLLPGMIIPTGDIETAIKRYISTTPFEFEEITGYFSYRGESFFINTLENRILAIRNIGVYLDENGYVRSKVEVEGPSHSCEDKYVSYFEVASNQLFTGNKILIDCEGNILHRLPSPKGNPQQADYSCPFCGRHYVIDEEFSRCPDTHCVSRLYPDISHFLSKTNLPQLEYEDYLEYVNSKEFTKLSDIFMLPVYRDCEIVISLHDLIDAIVPIDQIRDRTILWNFVSACNSSLDTLYYYMEHPNLLGDLKIDSPQLVTWFSDNKNVENVKNIIQYTNVVISANSKKFEGSPIFRDKKIYLTGKFSHGTLSEVSSILASYSAEITTSDDADCCIIGDIAEDINGDIVNRFKDKNIPIFNECDFFAQYEIDSDLY